MEALNIAIAGSGAIAGAHLDAYLALDGVRVTAIVTSDETRGLALAARAPGARVTLDLDEVLADESIIGVDVCGHTQRHVPVAVAALQAGKHVLVEKPPAITLERFDQLVVAARNSGLVAMIGQTVRFQPTISSIIESVDAGSIGRPALVHISWYVAHVWPRAWRGWQLDPLRSGGHLIHNGMHPIDLAIKLLADRPREVFCRGWATYSPDLPTPDSFQVLMRCEQGGLASMETSYALRPPADPVRRIVVAGNAGTIAHSTTDEVELFNPTMAGVPASIDNAMRNEVDAWLAAVRGERPTPITLDHSRMALAAAIAAEASLQSGRPEPVELS